MWGNQDPADHVPVIKPHSKFPSLSNPRVVYHTGSGGDYKVGKKYNLITLFFFSKFPLPTDYRTKSDPPVGIVSSAELAFADVMLSFEIPCLGNLTQATG